MSEFELQQSTKALTGNLTTAVTEEKDVRQIREQEFIKRVEIQPVVEIHEQPRITEVHEQKVVELIQQPITRVVHEKPIITRVVDRPGEIETKIVTEIKAVKNEELFKQKNVEKELIKEAF
jgi:hypothetical protein